MNISEKDKFILDSIDAVAFRKVDKINQLKIEGMSKILNKLVGKKSKAVVTDEKCCNAPTEEKRTMYKVTAVLNKEKNWIEELQKYLLVDPNTEKILILDTPNVEFEQSSDYWRITDKLWRGVFDSVTITVVK